MSNKKAPATHSFPPETAGRVMTPLVPVVTPEATIADIERLLLQKAREFDSINYVYVTDREKRLLGVISIKEVFRCPKRTPSEHILIRELITVRPHTDQERVAHLALQHHLKAVPVVDSHGVFLGAVLSDTILTTLYREMSEDLLRLAGIKQAEAMFDDVLKIPVTKSLQHRLPWLLLGLLGGILAAKIIGQFEHTLAQNLILAAFIPLMVYMADAVGTQMEAFIIRDLAVNPGLVFGRYFCRQLAVIGIIGIITGLVLFVLCILLYKNFRVGYVLGLSLFIAITSSVVTGLFIPYLFGKFRFDPANASGPIATIVQDILTVTIFFLIASWLL